MAPNNSVALLLFRGQPALALPFDERAVPRAPSNPNAHPGYARALLIVGRMDEVQPHIDPALRLVTAMRKSWPALAQCRQMRLPFRGSTKRLMPRERCREMGLPTHARAGICEAGMRNDVSRGVGDLTIYRACEGVFIRRQGARSL